MKWIHLTVGVVLGIGLGAGLSAAGLYWKHRHEIGRYGYIYEGEVEQEAIRCRQFHDATVFIGDSNAYALATSNIAPKSENLGINGDTLDRALYRLPSCDLHGAKAVVIALGTNDWADNRYDGFEIRYRQLLHLIPRNVRIVASAIPPVNEQRLSAFYETAGMSDGILAANVTIRRVCASDGRCEFSPMPHELYAGRQLSPVFDSGFGVHLNARGQSLWSTALASHLR